MKNSHEIARHLVILSNILEHINSIERFYDSIRERDGDLDNLTPYEEHSYLSELERQIKEFKEIQIDDLEDHHIGCGIKIVPRAKVLEILNCKDEFVNKIVGITKDSIMQLLTTYYGEFEGLVVYRYPEKMYAYFDIKTKNYLSEPIIIKNAFMGYSEDEAQQYLPNSFAHMIGFTF